MKIFDRPTYYSLFIITLTTAVAAYIASLCALPIEPILALVPIIMAYPCFHGMSYQYAITPLEARMSTLITLLAYPIAILTQLSLLSLNHWGIDLPHLPSIIIAAHIVIFLTSGLFCGLYFNQRLETSKGLKYKLKIHEWCEAYPCLDRIAQTWTPQPFEHESVDEIFSLFIGSGTLARERHLSREQVEAFHQALTQYTGNNNEDLCKQMEAISFTEPALVMNKFKRINSVKTEALREGRRTQLTDFLYHCFW